MRRLSLFILFVSLFAFVGCTPVVVVRIFNRASHPIRVFSEEKREIAPGDSVLVHAWSAKKGDDYGVLITEAGIDHFFPVRRALIESMPREARTHHWYAAAGSVEVSVEYASDAKLYAVDARRESHARLETQPLGFPLQEKR